MKKSAEALKVNRASSFRIRVYIGLLVFVLVWLAVLSVQSNLDPVMNKIEISATSEFKEPVKIAFISDIHFQDDESSFKRYESALDMIKEAQPDLILLGGDYIDMDANNIEELRVKVVKALDQLVDIAPTYGIFGNHEVYTGELSWHLGVQHSKIRFMYNEIEEIFVNGSSICVRGLGDYFTDRYKSIPFPEDCSDLKVTITHDPYVAEIDPEGGIYLAGHTHCGQIVFPLIGALWTPTRASKEFHCGLGKKDDRTWVTSAGLGATSVPFRVGTHSGFEMIIYN